MERRVTIIEDTRQKDEKHDLKHNAFDAAGVRVVRSKLPYGDYAPMPPVAVDTKYSILELIADVCQAHERFKRECEGAYAANCQLIILVENEDGITKLDDLETWENPRAKMNKKKGMKPPMTGRSLMLACSTMERKYGVWFEFCTPENAGERVLRLLGLPHGKQT